MNIQRAIRTLLMVGIVLVAIIPVFAQEDGQESQKVDLNFATKEELSEVPLMTSKILENILTDRPYRQLEDLLKIKGVTPKIIESFQKTLEIRKLNINAATVYELTVLPGIDTKLAEAIIALLQDQMKEDNVPYKEIHELLQISGIGDKELAAISEFIEAGPYVDPSDDRGWKLRKKNYPIPPRTSTQG